MKMNEQDRLRVTAKCKEYIKDREKLLKLFMKEINGPVSEKAEALYEKLRRKWDIPSLVLRDNGAGPRFEIYERGIIDPVSEDEWFSIRRQVDDHYGNRSLAKIPYHITIDGKYLYVQLRIDLRKTQIELGEAFDKMIMAWKNISKERLAKTTHAPLEVWELHEEKKLNFTQIARQLSGRGGNPSYEPNLMAEVKNVKRAYKKACEMINQVLEEARTREREIESSNQKKRVD